VTTERPGRVVRVVPDVSGIAKEFDYSVPDRWSSEVDVGSLVRVELNRRRVAGWVVDADVVAPEGVTLRPLSKVSSVGPSAELVSLARWAAHRWSGRLASILTSASPDRMVLRLPRSPDGPDPALPEPGPRAADAFSRPGVTLVRTPPAEDLADYVLAAARTGDAVIVAPTVDDARHHGARLRAEGARVYLAGRDFAQAATAGSVIGARSGVWARVRELSAVLVLDEHDESLQEERNPTWHARDVAIERARRAGVPCVLLSSVPSLAALAAADRVVEPSRGEERRGWPTVHVADRRQEDPGRGGLFSPQLVRLVRSEKRVICVLNRKGRAKMLACASCGELVRTEDGEHLMAEIDGVLRSDATGEERPLVCAVCTGTTLKRLRLGVTRASEELSALAGESVTDLSAERAPSGVQAGRLVVGTEAALHHAGPADAVVFLDVDQELLAPRYRAGEQAMALIARAARLVGADGELLLQTRSPDHRVVRAAVQANPNGFSVAERTVREAAGWPPFRALAEVSGAAAPDFVAPIHDRLDVDLLGPRPDGRYLVRTEGWEALAELLATLPRPKGRLRVAVDPPRA
jgi:primosomal protein N' (replication factor Y)